MKYFATDRSEHERHASTCPLVKGDYTCNVPVAVTMATQPAVLHGVDDQNISCLSTTCCPDLFASGTIDGSVVLWNISGVLKVIAIILYRYLLIGFTFESHPNLPNSHRELQMFTKETPRGTFHFHCMIYECVEHVSFTGNLISYEIECWWIANDSTGSSPSFDVVLHNL